MTRCIYLRSELLCAFGCEDKNGSCSAFRYDPTTRACHMGGLEPSTIYLRKGTGIDVKANVNYPPEVGEKSHGYFSFGNSTRVEYLANPVVIIRLSVPY